LHGELTEEIYQPKKFVELGEEGKVRKLLKGMYQMKQVIQFFLTKVAC